MTSDTNSFRLRYAVVATKNESISNYILVGKIQLKAFKEISNNLIVEKHSRRWHCVKQFQWQVSSKLTVLADLHARCESLCDIKIIAQAFIRPPEDLTILNNGETVLFFFRLSVNAVQATDDCEFVECFL